MSDTLVRHWERISHVHNRNGSELLGRNKYLTLEWLGKVELTTASSGLAGADPLGCLGWKGWSR